jgi:hypothetical protein
VHNSIDLSASSKSSHLYGLGSWFGPLFCHSSFFLFEIVSLCASFLYPYYGDGKPVRNIPIVLEKKPLLGQEINLMRLVISGSRSQYIWHVRLLINNMYYRK